MRESSSIIFPISHRIKEKIDVFNKPKQEEVLIDPYEVLNLQRDATHQQIVESYRRLAILNHPNRYCHTKKLLDTMNHDREVLNKWHFTVLAASFETLSEQQYRHRYDDITKKKQQNKKKIKTHSGKDYKVILNLHKSIIPKTSSSSLSSVLSAFSERESSETHVPNSIFTATTCSRSSSFYDQSSQGFFQCTQLDYDSEDEEDLSLCDKDCDSDTSSKDNDKGIEAINEFNSKSTRETKMLFVGPLLMLYRARNHEPFTDPFLVFQSEFGSDIFQSCTTNVEQADFRPNKNRRKNPTINNTKSRFSSNNLNRTKIGMKIISGKNINNKGAKGYPNLPPLPPNLLDRNSNIFNLPTESNCSSPPKLLIRKENGITTKKTWREVNGSLMVRTETTITDPTSGNRRTKIEVERKDIGHNIAINNNRYQKNIQSGIATSPEFDFPENLSTGFPVSQYLHSEMKKQAKISPSDRDEGEKNGRGNLFCSCFSLHL